MKNIIKTSLIGIVVVIGVLIYFCAYTIDEKEQVVITQFGKVIGETKKDPGLKFKSPIQKVNVFPDVLLEWDGDPGQVNTKDKKYIWVDTFARWRIVNPIKFLKTVGDVKSAQNRLSEIINSEMRNLVTSHSLVESVRNTDRAMDTFQISADSGGKNNVDKKAQHSRYKIILGRDKMTAAIRMAAQPKLKEFGIELEDVKIKRINYIDKVRKAVYGRMIAERSQIAEKFRAEGMGKASEIRGEKERELQVIQSGAYKKAQIIKGKADAEATLIYAKAYGVDPEFYAFLKTLDVYKTALGQDSTLVLSTDSDFMKYFKDMN